MKRRYISFGIIYFIILALYMLLFWVIPFEKDTAVIFAHVFALLSVLVSFGVFIVAFQGDELKSKVYGIPITYISVLHMTIQIGFSFVIALINSFTEVETWIVVVIAAIMFAVCLIGIIMTDAMKNEIELQERSVRNRTKNIRTLCMQVGNICSECNNVQLKAKLNKLEEELKYSDPVSRDDLVEIEGRISSKISELTSVVNSDTNYSLRMIDEIIDLVSFRNKKCKEGKK